LKSEADKFNRGLVVGKFMPIHNGHVALIRFAASQCKELIVSMSYTTADPINAHLRFSWLKEIFADDPHIKTFMLLDDFDDESLLLFERTKIWAAFIKKTYPGVDAIFSSENYGEPFALHLGVSHVVFDLSRTQIPVSATLIRSHPLQHWDFIPSVVRPYFVKKICLYGPESTGKSTMAAQLAELYNTTFVPEVARELIASNDFTVEDIVRIGRAQTDRVIKKAKTANKFLFCDTDVITTQIYSRHYLNVIPEELYRLENAVTYHHYFLFDIDTPWVADGLRDLGDKRQEMYKIFEDELIKRNISYSRVHGNWSERLNFITCELKRWDA
jgi:HTH-type transcriptional regulator, transcriptional repressor of NAD biosynthesis genes